MKRLVDETTDELARSLLQAGIEHRPPPGSKAQLIVALGAGGALGMLSSNAFAWLGTTAGKVTALGVAVGVASAVWVAVPPSQEARSRVATNGAATSAASSDGDETEQRSAPPSSEDLARPALADAPPFSGGASTTRGDLQRSDLQRSDSQRSDSQRSDSQRSDSQRSDSQRSDSQRSDSQRSASGSVPATDAVNFPGVGTLGAGRSLQGQAPAAEAWGPADADAASLKRARSSRRERGALALGKKRLAAEERAVASNQSEPRREAPMSVGEAPPAGVAFDERSADPSDLDTEVRLVDDMHSAVRRNDREALGRFLDRYRATFPEGQLKREVAEFAARLERPDLSGAR